MRTPINRMLVILEGPDNIGKSTLAKEMRLKYGGEITKFDAPKAQGAAREVEMYRVFQTAVKQVRECREQQVFLIWDRSPIGECVYGPLYRDYYPVPRYMEKFGLLKSYAKDKRFTIVVVVFYADQATYKKFGIPPKQGEQLKYEKQDESERISKKFIEEVRKLEFNRTLYISCNLFQSLTLRNKAIYDYIDSLRRG